VEPSFSSFPSETFLSLSRVVHEIRSAHSTAPRVQLFQVH
jgi:hypothetical protein